MKESAYANAAEAHAELGAGGRVYLCGSPLLLRRRLGPRALRRAHLEVHHARVREAVGEVL